MSKEEARRLLEVWDFFEKNPQVKSWKRLPRSEFFLLITILTENEDLTKAREYLKKIAAGEIVRTLPSKEVLEKAKEEVPEEGERVSKRQAVLKAYRKWIETPQTPKNAEEKEAQEVSAAELRASVSQMEKIEEVKAPPSAPPTPTPKALPAMYLAVKYMPAPPLSFQKAVRRTTLAVGSLPFNMALKLGGTAAYDKDPEKLTVATLASRGVTRKMIEPLKSKALAAGFSESQWETFTKALEEVSAGARLRTSFGRPSPEDVEEIIFATRRLSISPAQVSQFLLVPSADGSGIVIPKTSFAGGIISQLGQGILGRPAAAFLGRLLGLEGGKVTAGAAAGAATKAAAATAAKRAVGAGIGATIGNIPGAIIGFISTELVSRAISFFQRNKEKVFGFILIGIGALVASFGFAVGGLALMGLGGLSLLGSVSGGLGGASTQVASLGGSILYALTHIVVPSIAIPLAIAVTTITFLVALIFFIINNSAFVLPFAPGAAPPGIPPPGGVILPIPGGCKVPTSGLCSLNDSVTRLSDIFKDQSQNAAQICLAESGGQQNIINDGCLENPLYNRRIHTADYSVGLFQINMLSHPNTGFLSTPEGQSLKAIIAKYGAKSCYEAFSNYKEINAGNYALFCQVANQNLLNDCVAWFQDPANNVAYANFLLSKESTKWSDWSTARACGIVK